MFAEFNENESDHNYFCIPKNMLSINISSVQLCIGGTDMLALFAILCNMCCHICKYVTHILLLQTYVNIA